MSHMKWDYFPHWSHFSPSTSAQSSEQGSNLNNMSDEIFVFLAMILMTKNLQKMFSYYSISSVYLSNLFKLYFSNVAV